MKNLIFFAWFGGADWSRLVKPWDRSAPRNCHCPESDMADSFDFYRDCLVKDGRRVGTGAMCGGCARCPYFAGEVVCDAPFEKASFNKESKRWEGSWKSYVGRVSDRGRVKVDSGD